MYVWLHHIRHRQPSGDNFYLYKYITFPQRFSHSFSAESKDKASEILTAICKGYKEGMQAPQPKEVASVRATTERKKGGHHRHKANKDGSEKKVLVFHFSCSTNFPLMPQGAPSASKEHRASKSDHLVSRMKNFFQVIFLIIVLIKHTIIMP